VLDALAIQTDPLGHLRVAAQVETESAQTHFPGSPEAVGLAAGDPQRRMGLLHRLRNDRVWFVKMAEKLYAPWQGRHVPDSYKFAVSAVQQERTGKTFADHMQSGAFVMGNPEAVPASPHDAPGSPAALPNDEVWRIQWGVSASTTSETNLRSRNSDETRAIRSERSKSTVVSRGTFPLSFRPRR
jgi:hypothetical protein